MPAERSWCYANIAVQHCCNGYGVIGALVRTNHTHDAMRTSQFRLSVNLVGSLNKFAPNKPIVCAADF